MSRHRMAEWTTPSPARTVEGIRYGWLVSCPHVGCGWFEVRADEDYADDPETSARQVLEALLDQHDEDEHPEP